MKKLVLASFLVLVTAASSFAATAALVSTDGTMQPPKGFTPSNNVVWGYVSAANSVGVNDRYSIATKHTSGDKVYGTTSASGIVYSSTAIGTGTALLSTNIPTVPPSATDSTMTGGAGGWTAM